MEKHCFTADIEHEDQRIDRYLTEMLPEQSRSFFQKLIRDGFVMVNHIIVKVNYRLKTGDVIEIDIPDAVPTEIVPENIPLDILYEDDDLLIVNKPKGMVVHPAVGHSTGTLVNAIMYHCQGNLSGINGEIRPGIVHRIDKDTSGLLVVAKHPEAKSNLSLQFFNKTTKRKYRALVWGIVQEDEGRIEGNIGRDPRDRMQMTVFPEGDQGKTAVTHYTVLERLGYVSLVECRLETGRTHQIRVHLAHII